MQKMITALTDILERAVNDRVFPGCVVGVVSGGSVEIVNVGRMTYEHDAPGVTATTVYDIASVTKSIPVSSLALTLIDSGKLVLDEPIRQYLPDLRTSHVEKITPWHLLTQTLDYRVSLASLKDQGSEVIKQEIFSAEFFSPPGEKMNYSNATSILLGLLIERVSGKSLDRYADEIFFTPLGMTDTTFHPETFARERIAPSEYDPWRNRVVQGVIHDESSYLLAQQGMVPGSAGVFSTAPDLGKFLSMLLKGGVHQEQRYFSERMITMLQENQLAEKGESVALGWELNQPRYMGKHSNQHMIGKTGFTGCVVICDIPKKRGMVMLSNYHFPQRKSSVMKLNSVRAAVADIVFA